jgi:hypothetical protein
VQRRSVRGRKEKSLPLEETNLIFVGTDPVYRLYEKLKTELNLLNTDHLYIKQPPKTIKYNTH